MISIPFRDRGAEVPCPDHRVAMEEIIRPHLDLKEDPAERGWVARLSLTPFRRTA